jgi:hypothetical protein
MSTLPGQSQPTSVVCVLGSSSLGDLRQFVAQRLRFV